LSNEQRGISPAVAPFFIFYQHLYHMQSSEIVWKQRVPRGLSISASRVAVSPRGMSDGCLWLLSLLKQHS
jgi:hypothetical protein